jgi:hypothetical protein
MEIIKNKPRVFLSYSRSDATFIDVLDGDLRNCHIEPWRDTLEIRHGEPWLDAIFESGIPTCDCVLVYLTEASLESPVVKKEIDAGILQKLKDKRIAFLPYVSTSAVRARLRADIQTLQSPEWNPDNYKALLPRVVAEIWRSYLDRTLASAISEEHTKRLEAELQLQQLKGQEDDIFTRSEQKDFAFIHNTLNRREEVVFATKKTISANESEVQDTFTFEVNMLSLVMALVDERGVRFQWYDSQWILHKSLANTLPDPKSLPKGVSINCTKQPEFSQELCMFGLLEGAQSTETPFMNRFEIRTAWHLIYTAKMNRFRYWLRVMRLMPKGLEISAVIRG